MLAWLERHQVQLLAAAVLFLLAGVVRQLDAGSPDALVFRDGPLLPDGTPIQVQVTGAVIQPGVYEFHAGDRVHDALRVAGGPADGATLDALNLARRLRDGEKLTVAGQASRPAPAPTLVP